MAAVLARGRLEADALREFVRNHALTALAGHDAFLALEGAGFLERGGASCDLAPVYARGRRTGDRPIGVLAAYVSRHGHALVGRSLTRPTTRPAWRPPGATLAAEPQPRARDDRAGGALGCGS